MEAPPVGLLTLSDKELHAIFDALSRSPRVSHYGHGYGAVDLSRTCRRLDAFYRLEYVNAYDRTENGKFHRGFAINPFDDFDIHADAVARALLRLPMVTTLIISTDHWRALRVGHPVPARINKLSLHSTPLYGKSRSVDDDLATLPGVLPALLHLNVVKICRSTEITQKGFAGVVSLSSLQTLELSWRRVSSYEAGATVVAMPAALLQLTRLRRLTLGGVCLNTELLEGLPHGLVELSLSFCSSWASDFLRHICALPNLRSFDLSWGFSERVADWSVFLPTAARLESLVIHDANFDDSSKSSCFHTLSSMKQLTYLSLRDISSRTGGMGISCRTYSDVLLAAATLPMLKTLSIDSSYPVLREGRGERRECAVSPSDLVALGNGRVRRSLMSLSLCFLVGSFEEGCSFEKLCTELFLAESCMPLVRANFRFTPLVNDCLSDSCSE